MKKIQKICLVSFLALALIVGVGVIQASASTTYGVNVITETGALTITGAVGSNMGFATTTTTGNINIGNALTTGTLTIGGGDGASTQTIGAGAGVKTGSLWAGSGANVVTIGSTTGAATLNLNSGTTGLTTVTGDLLVSPVRRNALTADTNLVNIDASTGNLLSGTTGRTFLLNITGTRANGSQFTAGGDDAGLKVSVTNKNTTAQNDYVLRGINVGATNRLGGNIGTLQGGLISATQKGDADSPIVNELTGLQVTVEQDSPNTVVPANLYGLKVRYDAVMAAPTNSAGVYVYNDSDTALTDPTAAVWVGNSAADRQWKYGLYLGNNSTSVADIRLSTGVLIESGSGAPGGSCVAGSLYLNSATTGGTYATYQCKTTTWTGIGAAY